MSLQLRMLNPLLRLIERRYLSNMPSVEHARIRFERNARWHFHTPKGVYNRREVLRHDGHEIEALAVETGPVPGDAALLYLHGGGYFMASAEGYKCLAGSIAKAAGMRAYLPDYRLAPEHPFPAALDDALAAYQALQAKGINRIVIGGDSAGGGLVLALLHMICTMNLPQPVATVAISPWVDLTLSSPTLVSNEASDVMLPARHLPEVVAAYCGDTPADDPRVSPQFGTFTGAAPVLVHVSQVEIFLGEAEALVAAMTEQGVDVTFQTMDDTPHVWHLFHGFLPEADNAIASIGSYLRQKLAGKS